MRNVIFFYDYHLIIIHGCFRCRLNPEPFIFSIRQTGIGEEGYIYAIAYR